MLEIDPKLWQLTVTGKMSEMGCICDQVSWVASLKEESGFPVRHGTTLTSHDTKLNGILKIKAGAVAIGTAHRAACKSIRDPKEIAYLFFVFTGTPSLSLSSANFFSRSTSRSRSFLII